jgi:ACDE family multidrug resistance protein
MNAKKWDLISLSSIPLIMTLGNSMLIPILPQIARRLHVSSFLVSMLITVYAIVAILLIPIAGYLSDRYGRKRVIIPSLIITGIGGAISAAAGWLLKDTAYWVILCGRLLQGVGAAGAAPIVMPLIGDIFYRERDVSKGLGIIETANTFGKVLSPVLGAFLGSLVWFFPFAAIPLFCAISILMVTFGVESPKKSRPTVSFADFRSSVKSIFRQKGRWLYAIFMIGCICMFVTFGVLFYLSSTLEEEFGIDGVPKGLVLAIPLAALCMASYTAGKTIGPDKIRMKWVSFIGMALVTGSIFIIGWHENIYFVIGSLIVSGAGIGIVLPSLDALITEGIDKEQRGTITSLYNSMRFIGVSLGPPLVSMLMRSSHRVLFFTLAFVCAMAGVLTLLSIRPRHAHGKPKASESEPLNVVFQSSPRMEYGKQRGFRFKIGSRLRRH